MIVQAPNNNPQKTYTPQYLANTIDHTLLRSTATKEEIRQGAEVSKKHGFRSFVVREYYGPFVKGLLKGSNVLTCVVCDFPDGMSLTDIRKENVKSLFEKGMDDVDIVSKYHLLLDNDFSGFEEDIRAVVEAASDRTFKIILETDYLNNEELIKTATDIICKVVKEIKAKNVIIKTNTGYAKNEFSNLIAVKAIKERLEKHGLYADKIEEISLGKIGIKASARIKKREDGIQLLEAGAHILGTSSGDKII
ncbi:MAG: deoxyribose-phosphate aldolase [Candidatus Melainabacteria bacterium]|nr:deoxyribose-phosphate aldolase [Candidatus Melainabacteria bacterium]